MIPACRAGCSGSNPDRGVRLHEMWMILIRRRFFGTARLPGVPKALQRSRRASSSRSSAESYAVFQLLRSQGRVGCSKDVLRNSHLSVCSYRERTCHGGLIRGWGIPGAQQKPDGVWSTRVRSSYRPGRPCYPGPAERVDRGSRICAIGMGRCGTSPSRHAPSPRRHIGRGRCG